MTHHVVGIGEVTEWSRCTPCGITHWPGDKSPTVSSPGSPLSEGRSSNSFPVTWSPWESEPHGPAQTRSPGFLSRYPGPLTGGMTSGFPAPVVPSRPRVSVREAPVPGSTFLSLSPAVPLKGHPSLEPHPSIAATASSVSCDFSQPGPSPVPL